MSLPVHYRQVIQRVIERSASCLTASQLAEAIVDGLDLAEAILGDSPAAPVKPNVRIQTLPPSPLIHTVAAPINYPVVDMDSGAVIGASSISEEAPPATVRNPTATSLQDSYAETEVKKNDLVARAINVLPVSLTVDLPNVGQLTLTRFVKRAPEGAEFVRVLYALTAEDEDAPQVNLVTGKPFDPDQIMQDIRTAAAMRYRKTKPVIVPRVAPHPGVPDFENMVVKPTAADLAQTSEEDLADWRRLSGRTSI